MKDSILLTHLFVESNESYKLDIIDLCVSHFRKHNPDCHILITGHGLVPHTTTLDICDDYYWDPNIIRSEINVGHPKLVNIGFDRLKRAGYITTCKARIDSINIIPDIATHCNDIVTSEGTRKLVSTTNNWEYYMGDLFTYGDIDFLQKCWNIDTWYPTNTGLSSLGKNFIRALGGEVPECAFDPDIKIYNDKTWHQLVTENVSYRTPHTLKWVDFRKHWDHLTSTVPNYRDRVLENDFDSSNYIWNDWPTEPHTRPYDEDNFYGNRR